MTTETLTVANNGTPWTCPAGVTSVQVEMWGGGGKGARVSTNGVWGGGGGGGAYSRLNAYSVTPSSTYAFQVGTGSSSTVSGATNDTYWVSTGVGLAKAGASLDDNVSAGAAGGALGSGVGDTRYSGGSGADGEGSTPQSGGGGGSATSSGNGATATSRIGGSGGTDGGAGGNGVLGTQGNGSDGSIPGGGGGGAGKTSGGPKSGGNGADGRIILTYTAAAGFARSFAVVF